jgi:DNA-binding MarR family transcriptional regulator
MSDRTGAFDAMDLAGREISTAAVNFHAAVAAARGLGPGDTKALDLLLREGPLTHADLGARTGLAPASVTGLINRLEAKGLVRRDPHPDDGRSVLIAADADAAFQAMAPLFTPWVEGLHRLYADYSDEQLATIADFMRRAAALQDSITRDL